MNALPFILGGGALLLLVGVASKAKASTSSSGTTTPTTATASTSVPLTIINEILATGDRNAAQQKKAWLTANGYPQTGFAVIQWLKGEITDDQLRQAAAGGG